ncbi:sulfite exporter TauE/SafE family protein [Brucella pituitosa]|uniref:sulfite exporter TauE/SafE family protein n=1 Tax=Brucella pituitosa TaxID=571256 RepID=UPI003F4A880D
MFDLSTTLILTIAATFFAAGIVKGIAGMGLPTLAMGVLGSLISPLAAASLLLVPSFTTNVWQMIAGPNSAALIRRLWPMMLAIIVGTMLGVSWLTKGDTTITTATLGACLSFYAAFTLLAHPFKVPQKLETWLSPIVGAITGFIAGATGVFVIPAVPYLQALGLEKDELVQALGLSFTISTIALALGLGVQGALVFDQLAISTMAIVPALAGMWAGQIIRRKVSPVMFRRGFLICLLLLGLEMLLRPLF